MRKFAVLVLGSVILPLSVSAQSANPVSMQAVFCDTQIQIKRYLELRLVGKHSLREAIGILNTEERKPDACVPALVGVTKFEPVETVTIETRQHLIIKARVEFVFKDARWRQTRPAEWFSSIMKPKASVGASRDI